MGMLVGNYKFQEKYTSPGIDTKTFLGQKVARKCIAMLSHMSVSDYTTNAKKLILGIRGADGSDHYLKTALGTSTDIQHTAIIEGNVILLESEAPIAIVESPTASDVLYAAFHGAIYKSE